MTVTGRGDVRKQGIFAFAAGAVWLPLVSAAEQHGRPGVPERSVRFGNVQSTALGEARPVTIFLERRAVLCFGDRKSGRKRRTCPADHVLHILSHHADVALGEDRTVTGQQLVEREVFDGAEGLEQLPRAVGPDPGGNRARSQDVGREREALHREYHDGRIGSVGDRRRDEEKPLPAEDDGLATPVSAFDASHTAMQLVRGHTTVSVEVLCLDEVRIRMAGELPSFQRAVAIDVERRQVRRQSLGRSPASSSNRSCPTTSAV